MKLNRRYLALSLNLIVCLIVTLFTIPAFAQGLRWSDTYSATDVVLTGNNTDSGNVAYGTLLEYKTASGNKPIGFGGLAVGISADHKMSLNVMGFTFLNDLIWTGVHIDGENLRMNNLKENLTPVIGVSLLKFNGVVNK